MIEFMRSRAFFMQFGLALLAMILILTITYNWLGFYTNHGETVSVPNLKDMKYADLEKFLKDNHST